LQTGTKVISDFPWSKYLKWRSETHSEYNSDARIDLFNQAPCCGSDSNPEAKIKITSSSGYSSGFEGKWLKCENCNTQISLKGLMNLKVICPGHKPWEAQTGEMRYYSGDRGSRENFPPREECQNVNPMQPSLD